MMWYNKIAPGFWRESYERIDAGLGFPLGRPLALNKNDYFVKLSSAWRDPLGERI